MNQAYNTMILVPAYGRAYATKEALLADWEAGKDFRIVAGPYCSKRDLAAMKDLGYNVALTEPRIPAIIYL